MKEEFRARIRKNLLELKNSDFYRATDRFLKDGSITGTDAERIYLEPLSEDKNHKLLDVLCTKPDEVFNTMLNWLRQAGHKAIVDQLKAGDDISHIDRECKYMTFYLGLSARFSYIFRLFLSAAHSLVKASATH